MVSRLLDTSIVVDILRQYPLATNWLTTQSDLGITHIAWLEVLEGAENRLEQRRALGLLGQFERVEMTSRDLDWAVQQMTRYRLSHNVDPFDCLIAAVSHRLQLPLYTTNLKHFTPLLGALAQQPY